MISFLSRILPRTRLTRPGSEIFQTRCETPIFVESFEIGLAAGRQQAFDFGGRIAVQHEKLPKVGPGGP